MHTSSPALSLLPLYGCDFWLCNWLHVQSNIILSVGHCFFPLAASVMSCQCWWTICVNWEACSLWGLSSAKLLSLFPNVDMCWFTSCGLYSQMFMFALSKPKLEQNKYYMASVAFRQIPVEDRWVWSAIPYNSQKCLWTTGYLLFIIKC